MPKDIFFDKLGRDETVLLLRAFDYDVDKDGFILSPAGNKIQSEEIPSEFLKLHNVALIPGSLKVIDGSPTSISKFIRERAGVQDGSKS